MHDDFDDHSEDDSSAIYFSAPTCHRMPIAKAVEVPVALCVLLLSISPVPLAAQKESVTIPSGTPLCIASEQHYAMKVGQRIEGRLVYPVYRADTVAIPSSTLLRGTVIKLTADQSRRVKSRFDGDFTPFHTPVVHFDEFTLSNGTLAPFASDNATDGASVLRLATPVRRTRRSFISQPVIVAKQRVKEQVKVFSAPGRGDRLLQYFYHQLPYHPERIEAGTSWTIETTEPLTLTAGSFFEPVRGNASAHDTKAPTASSASPDADRWLIHAYLPQTVTSATAQKGGEIRAVVLEPIFNADSTVAVPEGATMVGAITQAQPARSFGRRGKLRFSFRQMLLPDGPSQSVQGTVVAAATRKSDNLQMDSEGGVEPESQKRVIVPLVLGLLASRTLEHENEVGHNATGANGLGLAGRLVGTLASSQKVAAGIGFMALRSPFTAAG